MDVPAAQTVTSVRRQGLSVVVHARRLVGVRVDLAVSRALARRLRLRSRVLGGVSGRVNYGQDLTANIRLTSGAQKALRGQRSLTATLRLVILNRLAPDRMLSKPVKLIGLTRVE
jgi:hypothetical protein